MPALAEVGLLLRRQVRQWRLAERPEKEVIFTQDHAPGPVLAVDWTDMGGSGGIDPGQSADPQTVPRGAAVFELGEWAVRANSESMLSLRAGLKAALGRLGKAALWVGATDSRFALVISNECGANGAKMFRCGVGEDIKRLNTVFPLWFTRNFCQSIGKDIGLPFDQHELIALIAPQSVYIASAMPDKNSDPEGEFAVAKAEESFY